MEQSIEALCAELVRLGVLTTASASQTLLQWRREGSDPVVPRFLDRLVVAGMLTEHQAGVIGRGHVNQLLVGPYVIQERIGKGRMAGVYRARHSTGAVVAVKVLPSSKASNPALLGRFQREARLALAVRHPNVITAYHHGEHRSLHYLVMELATGETLEETLLRIPQMDVSEAASLLAQAYLGLQAIHERGLVHRDLRPGNLMLLNDSRQVIGACLKILDLGTARELFDDVEEKGYDLTRPGEMLGSAEYMAPEQARDTHLADIRSDIYSLGCVLYHTLAGEPPFHDASHVKVLLRHATEEAVPIRMHQPAAPVELERLLARLLAKDPAARPQRPLEVARALIALQGNIQPPIYVPEEVPAAYLSWVDQEFGRPEAPTASPEFLELEIVEPPLPPQRSAPPPPRRPREPEPPVEVIPYASEVPEEEPAEEPKDWSMSQLVLIGAGTMLAVMMLGGILALVIYLVR